MYCNKLQIAPMGAPELQAVLAVGGGAGVFSPSTRSKSASFVIHVVEKKPIESVFQPVILLAAESGISSDGLSVMTVDGVGGPTAS